MKNLNFAFLFTLIASFSTASFAFDTDSECELQVVTSRPVNSGNSFNKNTPYHVFIGKNLQKQYGSAAEALHAINLLQESGSCQQNISSQIPECKIEFFPATRAELEFFSVSYKDTIISTMPLALESNRKSEKARKTGAYEKAKEIVDLLKQVRFCQ